MSKKKNILLGIDSLEDALNDGKELECVFIQKDFYSDNLSYIKSELYKRSIPVKKVPIFKLNKIARNHHGIVSIVSLVDYDNLETLIPTLFESAKVPAILLLDRITDVRNFGAIARSSEGMGVDAIVIPQYERALINEESIDISTKALLHIKICRQASLVKAIDFLKLSGLQIVGLDEKAENMISEVDLTLPTALLVGSEFDGITTECKKLCDKLVKIPMVGKTKSLNASVAAGISIYELVRQRNSSC